METHTAIFKGIVREITWSYYIPSGLTEWSNNNYGYEILEDDYLGFEKVAKEKELETFWIEEIENPIFEIGEKVWISDMGILVKITDKYRTTDGRVIYETNHVIRDVETERTESTRLIAVSRWLMEEFGFHKTFEEIKELYETKTEEVSELEQEKIQKPQILIGVDNPKVEEKSEEKTWFGWLNFFKKD